MIHHLLQWAISNTLMALVLALLALSAGLLCRRPAVTHGLWLLVLIKLFTPPVVALPVGTWPSTAPPVAPQVVPATNGPASARVGPAAPASPQVESLSEQFAAFDQTHLPATPPARPFVHGAVVAGVAAAWLAGTLICAWIALMRIGRFTRVLKDTPPAGAAHQAECDQAARRLGLGKSPRVRMLPGRVTPMLWAPLLVPRLLVPGELWDRLSRDQRQALLLHELAHFKRHDHWARWVELMATLVFWWNPLVWWARSQLRQAEEYCCDAWVTWALPEAADDYCGALVEVIDFTSQKFASSTRVFGSSIPALATGVSRFRHLSRRLLMIDRGTNNCRLGFAGAACIIATMAALPLAVSSRTNAVAAGPAQAPQPADPLAEQRGSSIDKGLEWLAANMPVQAAKPGADDPAAANRTAIVSLCGLAFLASGSDLQQGTYHVQLGKCVDTVLADCHDDGLIATEKGSALMYHHAYATLFLAEAYARTQDARIKPRLEKAVALIEKSQNAQGAWRYLPRPLDGDMSVTGCVLNALLAAQSAKIDVNPATIRLATKYVLSCKQEDGGYVYIAGSGAASGAARTAEAAAVLRHAGAQADSVDAAVKFLKPFAGNKEPQAFQSYFNYYAAQALAGAPDETSRVAYQAESALIVSHQNRDGSWDGDNQAIGKTFSTACSVLALQASDGKLWIFHGGK